jgi:hypothetical protein
MEQTDGGKEQQMAEHARNDAEGMPALSICESLLLALTDGKIITEKDARDLLTDVVTSHAEAAGASQMPDRHRGGGGDCAAHPGRHERRAHPLIQASAPLSRSASSMKKCAVRSMALRRRC